MIQFWTWRVRNDGTMFSPADMNFVGYLYYFFGVRDDVLYLVYTELIDGFWWGHHFTMFKNRTDPTKINMHWTHQLVDGGPVRQHCNWKDGIYLYNIDNSITKVSLKNVLCVNNGNRLGNVYSDDVISFLCYCFSLCLVDQVGGNSRKTPEKLSSNSKGARNRILENLSKIYGFDDVTVMCTKKKRKFYNTVSISKNQKLMKNIGFISRKQIDHNDVKREIMSSYKRKKFI